MRSSRMLISAGALAVAFAPTAVRAQSWSDGTFNSASWIITKLAPSTAGATCSAYPSGGVGNPAPSQATQQSFVGTTTTEGVWCAHTYSPVLVYPSTGISSLTMSIDLYYPTTQTSFAVGYWPLVYQNGTYYEGTVDQIFGVSPPPATPVWKTFTDNAMLSSAFTKLSGSGPANPDFSCTGPKFQIGFISANSSPVQGVSETTLSYADNWSLTVNPGPPCGPPPNNGTLKICKVAGPGITPGTYFPFTVGTWSGSVPAGPAPGGYCIVGPSLPVGSTATIQEAIPRGDVVSSIVAAPSSASTNLATGTATVPIGNGVTEVTYTDYTTTGYLEICKAGDVQGNFTFYVNPGNLGPFIVPAGACSPAIMVTAGNVVITEQTAPIYAIVNSTTIPPPAQGPHNFTSSTVTVVPGNISTETIVTITDARRIK